GQGQVGASGSTVYPATGNPAAPPPADTQYPAASQSAAAAPPAASSYNAAEQSAPGGAGGSGYQVADNRYASDRYAASQANTPTDRYAASGDPAGAAATEQPAGDRYQPGSTNYNPGQTGYAPPGVQPYQTPAQPNVSSGSRRDPYYRPGGTS